MDEGKIVINGKQLNTELLLPEFMDRFPEFQKDGWKISPGNYVCCAHRCDCYGRLFTVTARFQRRRLSQVRLYPEDVRAEEEAKAVCNTWLAQLLGAPHKKDPDITMYEYEWGSILTEQDSSMEPDCSIVIDFN